MRAVELLDSFKAWKSEPPRRPKDKDYGHSTATTPCCGSRRSPSSLQLHKTPLSIAPIFAGQRAGTPRSWIFTSATLAVKNDFKHFTAQMGMTGEPAQTWPSPFNYERAGHPVRADRPAGTEHDGLHGRRGRHGAARDRSGRRAHLLPVHDDPRRQPRGRAPARGIRRARPGIPAVRAGRARPHRTARFLPQRRQCRAGRQPEFLGRRGRARRGAVAGHHRQAAVRAAGRPGAGGAHRSDGKEGHERLHAPHAAGSHHQPEAGRRPPDPRRRRPRRADAVRSARDQQALRPPHLAKPAAVQAHAGAGRGHRVLQEPGAAARRATADDRGADHGTITTLPVTLRAAMSFSACAVSASA